MGLGLNRWVALRKPPISVTIGRKMLNLLGSIKKSCVIMSPALPCSGVKRQIK